MKLKKILIADRPEINIIHDAGYLFKRTRCRIFTADSGAEAIEAAKREQPDLIILDLYDAEMRGDECCRIIKDDPSIGHIPVIIMTYAKDPNYRSRCFIAGCSDFITKPVTDSNFLFGRLRKFVDIPARFGKRVPICGDVEFYNHGVCRTGQLMDISDSGIFIQTETPAPLGTVISTRFSLPNSSSGIRAVGRVARRRYAGTSGSYHQLPGMGVMFTEIEVHSRREILDFMKITGGTGQRKKSISS